MSHVELIGTTISQLLDGSPAYQGKKSDPVDKPGAAGATPLTIALDHSNIHHYLVGAQGALPVDAAGNSWSGSYVYNSGNLVPKTNAERFPEVKRLTDMGLQSIQYTFSADNRNEADKLFRGASPSNDGTELTTAVMPDGVPMTMSRERREEFSPGLDKELLALILATAEVEMRNADTPDE